jgi:hypothetical protein
LRLLQVWNALSEERALQLLPPLARCLGSPEQYTGPAPSLPADMPGLAAVPAVRTSSAAVLPPVGPDLAFLMAVHRSATEGEMSAAAVPLLEVEVKGGAVGSPPCCCVSVAGDVAMAQLAGWLLRRDAWPALDAAAGAARGTAQNAAERDGVGEVGEQGPAGSRRQGAAMGAAMLASLVRGAPAELLVRLVLFAEARLGLPRRESASVLAQTCSGLDAGVRERVREVLARCGLA